MSKAKGRASPAVNTSLSAHRRRQQTLDFVYRLAALFVKFAAIAFGLYQGRLAVEALAGQSTSVDVLVSWIKEDGVPVWASLALAFFGVIYGLRERAEKRRKTEALAKRVQELELLIDRKRSSSNLLPDGRTNPGDVP